MQSFPSFSKPEPKPRTIYDIYSPVYDFIFFPFFNFGRRASISRLKIQPGQRVLEVGCGTGASFSYFAPFFNDHATHGTTLIGVDLSQPMIEKARRMIDREKWDFVAVGVCDGQVLPFPDGHFDSVFAAYTFSVVPSPDQFLKEVLRVARSGAQVVFLNHLKSRNKLLSRLEEAFHPLAKNIGWQLKDDLREVIFRNNIENYTEESLKTNPIFNIICFNKP